MLSRTIMLILLSLGILQVFGQSGEDLKSIEEDVRYLASDKLKGREAGTKDELTAAKFIAKEFEKIGLKPMGNEGYFQTFTFKYPASSDDKSTADTATRNSRNVLGYIDNGGRNTIIIGAHYDHLGFGTKSSRHTGEKAIHNGADDNASGTAAMLLLANRLASKKGLTNNYLFIAFSAEEAGLLGSRYFVNNSTVKLEKINCMLNFDMVGRLKDHNELTLTGTGTSPKWDTILENVNLKNATVSKDPSGLGRSDHTSFYLKEVPVLNFFTGSHEDYHKPSDDVEKVDFDGIIAIVDYAENILSEVEQVLKLAYSTTEDADKRKEWENPRKSPKYKVTLGVMPDYTFEGEGMRIESVIAERPAAKAGLEDGDVVTKLGEIAITDMQSYMKALGQFNQGDKTTVHYRRNGENRQSEIEF